MNDNEGEGPVNLQEYRALRSQEPSAWTPRQVLQHLIDHIDKGELDPDHIVVIHGNIGDRYVNAAFLQGGSMNFFEQLGMLHSTMTDLTNLSKES